MVLNAYYGILRALLVMAFHFKIHLTCPLHVLLMLIGLVAPMTEKVLVVIVVSRSSAELEYRGLANAAAELIWAEALLAELHLSLPSPAALICDNISATQLAANPILHVQTKHIEIDFHFIRERVVNKSVEVYFTPSQEQLADIMTKPLPAQRSQSLRNRMTVLHNPISLRG